MLNQLDKSDIIRVPAPDHIYETLSKTLAKTPFTINSLYGIVILGILIFLIFKFFTDVKKCLRMVFSFIVLWELAHVIVTNTPIHIWIPFLGNLFKFDILTAIAQLCVGTKLSAGLLWIQAYLNTVIGGAFASIFRFFSVFFSWISKSMGI